MLWTPTNDWGAIQSSAVAGHTVTPAQNSKGSYSSSVAAAGDSYMLELGFSGGATAAAARDIIADIGIDYAGGTSYSVFIADLLVSCCEGVGFLFPVFVPSGATLACRGSVNNATVGTFIAWIKLYQKPSRPEAHRFGFTVDSFTATAASSSGTATTPGASGSEGTWTQLVASLSHDYFWWECGMGMNDGTMSQRRFHVDVSSGDGTNKQVLIENVLFTTSSAEQFTKPWHGYAGFAPSGDTLYGRIVNSGTNADTGPSMMAYGVRC